jgi:hypothetical protein
MKLRNRETGAVITDQQLRNENPNTSFPDVLAATTIDELGYDPVLEGAQPTLIPPYQTSVEDGVENINGQWFTKYVAGPIFTDYTDDEGVVHTASEQYEAYCFAKDAEQAKVVRADRNRRLAESDWTDLPNTPIDKEPWIIYRQALRDITLQEGFPWEVVWPDQP